MSFFDRYFRNNDILVVDTETLINITNSTFKFVSDTDIIVENRNGEIASKLAW